LVLHSISKTYSKFCCLPISCLSIPQPVGCTRELFCLCRRLCLCRKTQKFHASRRVEMDLEGHEPTPSVSTPVVAVSTKLPGSKAEGIEHRLIESLVSDLTQASQKHLNRKNYGAHDYYRYLRRHCRLRRCLSCGLHSPWSRQNIKGTDWYWIDFATCIDCGICIQVCPVGRSFQKNNQTENATIAFSQETLRTGFNLPLLLLLPFRGFRTLY